MTQKTKLLIVIIAIVLLALAGVFAATRQVTGPTEQDFPTTVDRGIDEEGYEFLYGRVAEVEAEIAASEERDISLLLKLGNLYYTLGELAKANEYYDDILSTHPGDAAALENKGQSLYDMGDYEGAERLWLAALQSNPYEVTYLRLADLYTYQFPEKKQEIRPLLEDAIASIGQTPGLLLALAHWYRDEGMRDEALSHYEVVLRLNPENDDVRDIVAEIRQERTREMQKGS